MHDDRDADWQPASYPQQAMWLNEQRLDAGTVYHMPFTYTVDGPLDQAAMLAAADAVVARHPALRSAFELRDGVPWVGPATHRPEVVVAEALPEADLDATLRREIGRRFDLRHGPLARMTLYPVAPDRHVLLVVVHHLVFDGESMELFGRDLAACYQATSAGSALPVPAPAATAADDERQRVADALPGARAWWQRHWREPSDVALPGLAGTPPEVAVGECVEFVLGATDRGRLREAAASIGVTSFEFLAASLYALLHRYGNAHPTVTVAVGLRDERTAGRIGSYAQEIPVPAALDAGRRFHDFALALRTQLRELYQFREVPINQAVRGVRPAAMHTPVSLSFRRHEPTVEFPGLRVQARWLYNSAARGALWIQVLDSGDGLRVVVRHPPEVVAGEDATRIADDWRQLLDAAVAAPHGDIDALPVSATAVSEPVAAAVPDAPTGPVDETVARDIAEIWREVLRVASVDAHDNLFDFGVNSLAVTQIATRIQHRWKVDIAMETFYDVPTVAGIAALVSAQRRRQEHSA